MEEEKIKENFEVLDTMTMKKNIDRLIPIDLNEATYLSTSYHLDKETSKKSGDLNILKVNESKIEIIASSPELPFGILSIN